MHFNYSTSYSVSDDNSHVDAPFMIGEGYHGNDFYTDITFRVSTETVTSEFCRGYWVAPSSANVILTHPIGSNLELSDT